MDRKGNQDLINVLRYTRQPRNMAPTHYALQGALTLVLHA